MALQKAAFAVLLLFSAAMSYSQHNVKGRVIDAFSMEPIYGAKITFNNVDSLIVTSDTEGKFEISADQALTSLDCTYVGYKNFNLKLKKRKTAILVEMMPVNDESKETDTLKSPADTPRKENP